MIYRNPTSTIFLLLIGLALATAACKSKGTTTPVVYPKDKYLSSESQIDGVAFRYRVYLPENRNPDEKLAVMLYLHGSGSRGNDNESQLNGLADQIEANMDKINFIIVIPQCPSHRFWDERVIRQADKALDDTAAEFKADTDRLYLAGFSLGGYGVWTMAAMYPAKFAAIVPMSGRVLPRQNEKNKVAPEIVGLAEASDPYKAFAERLGNTPTWIFHGADDLIVPIASSRKMFAAMKAAGNDQVKFDERPGVGHEPLAFGTDGFFEWLEAQHLSKK